MHPFSASVIQQCDAIHATGALIVNRLKLLLLHGVEALDMPATRRVAPGQDDTTSLAQLSFMKRTAVFTLDCSSFGPLPGMFARHALAPKDANNHGPPPGWPSHTKQSSFSKRNKQVELRRKLQRDEAHPDGLLTSSASA